MTTITGENQSRSGPPQAHEGPVVPVSGILDLGGERWFLRTAGYRVSPEDVAVPRSLVAQHGLRRGDLVTGAARPENDGRGRAAQHDSSRRQRRLLARVDAVNAMSSREAASRPDFEELTPLYPDERIRLGSAAEQVTARIVDLISPIGKGQRGLVVSPPKAGKTMVLKAIAAAIAATHPEIHLMMVLVGERPEEVTDIRRSVPGEVIFSTFDKAPADHILVAELAIERAKRLVELRRDVVVLLDSITRLGRAYNLAAPASSRILAGGVAATALLPPRQILGAARNIEEGGSLTILCSALVDTGSRMDDVFFEEFKGTGNMELRLRRDLAERRVFPAVDIAPSGTRRDDLLMSPDEQAALDELRRALAVTDSEQAVELLRDKTRSTASNADFLRQIRSARSPGRNRGARNPAGERAAVPVGVAGPKHSG